MDRSDNLMDHVFSMLESYASSLEEEVCFSCFESFEMFETIALSIANRV